MFISAFGRMNMVALSFNASPGNSAAGDASKTRLHRQRYGTGMKSIESA